MIALNTDRTETQDYEEGNITDPLNPSYEGPVMFEESRDNPFNWRCVVPADKTLDRVL